MEGRLPAAQMLQAKVTLELDATLPAEREISFDAWRPPGAEAFMVTVLLNDLELGVLDVAAEPGTYAIKSPKAAWRLGENELAFVVEQDALVIGPDQLPHGLAVSAIRYGAPARAERRASGFHLDAGAGLRYRVEERAAAELVVGATAEGAGELRIAVRRLAPSTLLPVEGDQETVITRALAGAAEEVRLTLPAAMGALLEVELLWTSEVGAGLNLTSLALFEAVEQRPPSIILISIDTLAARHTSLYGYGKKTSPELESFASGATVFDRAHTNAPWTMPSYAALMSGYFPSSARFSPNLTSTHFAFTFPEGRWALAEALSAAGYQTGAFVDSPNVGARLGFDQGFDVFDESARDLPHGAPNSGLMASSKAALAWLDGLDPGAPYFLFVHANDVHGPYAPKSPALGAFRDDKDAASERELPAGAMTGTFGQVPEYLLGSSMEGIDSDSRALSAAPLRRAYDESILSMDAVLGDVLAQLEKRGALDNAIVIFTADHGEAFDDHDLFGHGQLYQEVMQVPLVISLPKALRPAAPPAHVEQPVQLVDLYPTLIELAGLQSERGDLHGRSPMPLLLGQAAPLAASYSEGGIMRQSAVVFDRWKLVEKWPAEDAMPWTMLSNPTLDPAWLDEHAPEVEAGALDEARLTTIGMRVGDLDAFLEELRAQLPGPVFELYDLVEDPAELVNLAAQKPGVLADMQARLRAAKTQIEAARARITDARVEFSADELRDLEALGY